MKVKVDLLSSFGTNKDGGNPAGVVLDAGGLTDEEKKFISKEVGYPETAFVEKSDKADFKVTFFTPTDEVDMCGHATIATYSLLFQKGLVKSGKFTQELKAGILGIEIENSGLIIMDQTEPTYSEIIPKEEILKMFDNYTGIENLQPQIVSTGLRDIMLPVETRKLLFKLSPNFEKMSELNKNTNSIGVHAFTLDTINSNAIAHCRNFAPLYGIPEESATGSSNGALACYLFNNQKLVDRKLENMKFEQGYSMNKPSEIIVSLKTRANKIDQVRVGGKAIIFGENIVVIPVE